MKLPKLVEKFFYTGPYLANTNRMADILAAIQVLGTYEFASRELDKWEKRLGRQPCDDKTWNEVFTEHPEYFTIDNDKNVALVWRRSLKRNYDTKTNEIVDEETVKTLLEEENIPGNPKRLSRQPLNQSQIEHLCNLAINLHEREIQHRQEKRWWSTAVVAIIVGILSLF